MTHHSTPFGIARRNYADLHVPSPDSVTGAPVTAAGSSKASRVRTPTRGPDPLMDELRQKLSQRRSARKQAGGETQADNVRETASADTDGATSVADVAVQLFGSGARTSAGSASSMFSASTDGGDSVLTDSRDRSTQGSGRSLSQGSFQGNPSSTQRTVEPPAGSVGVSAGGCATPRAQRQSTHASSARAAVRAACGAADASADPSGGRPWRMSLFRHMATTPGRESIKRLFPRKRDV